MPTNTRGIHFIVGHPHGSDTMHVQSVQFAKRSWTKPRARAWLRNANLHYGTSDESANYLHFEQRPAGEFTGGSFRTIRRNPGPLLGALLSGVGFSLGSIGVNKVAAAATEKNPGRREKLHGTKYASVFADTKHPKHPYAVVLSLPGGKRSIGYVANLAEAKRLADDFTAEREADPTRNPLPLGAIFRSLAGNVAGSAAYDAITHPQGAPAMATVANPITWRTFVADYMRKHKPHTMAQAQANMKAAGAAWRAHKHGTAHNPTFEINEAVQVPHLDTTGVIKDVVSRAGLLGGTTKYKVELSVPIGTQHTVIIPGADLKRLNPAPASEPCPSCGRKVRVPKHGHTFTCRYCGATLQDA